MARYIDADKIHQFVDTKVAEGKDGWSKGIPYEWEYALAVIDEAPTADVVPRAELAREIFWEMDKLLLSITIDEETEESFVGFDFDKYIALKKKYTEANHETRN